MAESATNEPARTPRPLRPGKDVEGATEFENFTRGLKKILSVKKSDLDLHKPIRPRKPTKS